MECFRGGTQERTGVATEPSPWNPGPLELVEVGPGDQLEQLRDLIRSMPLHWPHEHGLLVDDECRNSKDIPLSDQVFVVPL
jgi:hypothetical protein